MVEYLLYHWSVFWTLTDAKSRKLFPTVDVMLLDQIAKNQVNTEYAVMSMRYKFVPDKYSAVAAVFARLAVLYHENPINGLNGDIFETLCELALGRAKCPNHLIPAIKLSLMDVFDER